LGTGVFQGKTKPQRFKQEKEKKKVEAIGSKENLTNQDARLERGE